MKVLKAPMLQIVYIFSDILSLHSHNHSPISHPEDTKDKWYRVSYCLGHGFSFWIVSSGGLYDLLLKRNWLFNSVFHDIWSSYREEIHLYIARIYFDLINKNCVESVIIIKVKLIKIWQWSYEFVAISYN